MDEEVPKVRKVQILKTVKNLRLDLEAAKNGKTWELLPSGFRDAGCGATYPLPSTRYELQKLVVIFLPPDKKDSGCIYLRRALKRWTKTQRRRDSAILDLGRREEEIRIMQRKFKFRVSEVRGQISKARDKVREEADKAVASLTVLFDLGREGLEHQMRAHLKGEKWRGEKIDGKAFRDCFRMVTQAVKGLGLPSEQREIATESIAKELVDAIKATRETVKMAPGSGNETEN